MPRNPDDSTDFWICSAKLEIFLEDIAEVGEARVPDGRTLAVSPGRCEPVNLDDHRREIRPARSTGNGMPEGETGVTRLG